MLYRFVVNTALVLAAASANAQDWGTIATISSTLGNNANRLCIGDGTRHGDFGCPADAPLLVGNGLSVSGEVTATIFSGSGAGLFGIPASAVVGLAADRITSGTHSVIANDTNGYVSLTTSGSDWGYLSSVLSYLPTLWSGRVSATDISATYVDATRNGTVSATYGYFTNISGSIPASMVTGLGSLATAGSVAWGDVTAKPDSIVSLSTVAAGTAGYGLTFDGTNYALSSLTTTLGLDSMAYQNANSVAITGGTSALGGLTVTGNSNLATVTATTVSASVGISTANVDATRNGTVSATYGYFTNISGSIPASMVTGLGSFATASDVQWTNVSGKPDSIVSLSTVAAGTAGYGVTFDGTNYALSSLTTTLGLGTMAYQNANSVAINGGSLDGVNVGTATVAGTISGTYGYFANISGSGAGLYGIPSSAVTGLSTDRITSGTHRVVANEASGYVSLSADSGATSWGYLGSGASFLPRLNALTLSSTLVSATNISGSLIQVGTGNGASCGSSTKGALRYSTTSSTVEYCNSARWTSLGPSDTTPISFYASKIGSSQSVASNASLATKITFDSVGFNSGNGFSGSTFTAPVAGRYLLAASVRVTPNASGNVLFLYLYKNGSYAYGSTLIAGSATNQTLSPLNVIVNAAAGDTFEVYLFQNTGSAITVNNTAGVTYFSGAIISPQSDGSGGSAAAAGSTNDVQYNSGGSLAADTGNFTYTSGLLTTPSIYATSISASTAHVLNMLGVGTTTPGAMLDVAAASPQIRITDADTLSSSVAMTANISFRDSNGDQVGWIGDGSSGTNDLMFINNMNAGMRFSTNGYEYMRATSAGRVGINTTSPDTALEVNGQISGGFGAEATTGTLDWNDASNARSGSGYTLLTRNATNGPGGTAYYYHPFSFEHGTKDGTGNLTQFAIPYGYSTTIANSMPMYIRGRYSGTWTSWFQFTMATVSDYRLKKNVKTITSGGLDTVMRMRPVRFSYVDEKGSKAKREGFIAHEMQEIAPYAVTGKKDEVDASGKPLYQNMNYGEITPLLTAAIQELKAANDTLVSETTALKAQLDAANDNHAHDIELLRHEVEGLKARLR